jgi:8-oxo-dGTP pyrophosphatase MutT (NUDIX family)
MFAAFLDTLPPPPSLAAARHFDRRRHLPFVIGAEPVGWIRLDDVERLRRWPAIFSIESGRVVLSVSLDSVASRTDALTGVIRQLADDGRITGWRDEIFAIRNRFDDPPLAFIERAASRFFGTMTYAVHANGVLGALGGPSDDAVPRLWIARRSYGKAVDPGMLDTLMGGGIGWGWGIAEALVKECWEESGVPAELVAGAERGRTIHVLAEIEQGTQAEQLFVFDLPLPVDFRPSAQDGEVEEHLEVSIDEALRAVADGSMTVDASLATLDCALRRGWVASASLAGFDVLCRVPD